MYTHLLPRAAAYTEVVTKIPEGPGEIPQTEYGLHGDLCPGWTAVF
jgi:hypothetical protein